MTTMYNTEKYFNIFNFGPLTGVPMSYVTKFNVNGPCHLDDHVPCHL